MESLGIEAQEEKNLLYKSFCQVYSWNETLWVERGRGPIKILKNTGKLEVILRQNTNNELITKFFVEKSPLCEVVQHSGNDRAWSFSVHENPESDLTTHIALRFQTPELAKSFKKNFEELKQKFLSDDPSPDEKNEN